MDHVISVWLLLVAALLCRSGQAVDPTLPKLPRYFTTFAEYYAQKNDSDQLIFLQGFYDEDFQIKRDDFAAEAFVPNSVGTLSVIDDASTGVHYSIYRHFSNCTISRLDPTSEDVFVNSTDGFRLKSLEEIFFLTDEFNYTYTGVETLRGIEVDTWTSSVFNYSSSSGLKNYTNTKTEVSFTRPDVSYPSLTSYSSEPVLVRFTLEGTVSELKDGVMQTTNLTSFENFVGGSYEEPSFDAFDVSICSDPSEYKIATLFIPGHVNGVDLSVLRKSIRSQFSKYTGLYPIQIGSIEILGENGTYIFVKLHLSNLTSIANVNNSVTANDAIKLLLDNSVDGRLPFPIELTPGNSLNPEFRFQNENQRCRSPAKSTAMMTVKPTGTASPPPPTSCPSECPSSGVITITHTVTTTPSGPTCPSNQQGLTTGPAVGLSFGMFIAGIVFTLISLCLFVICRKRMNRGSWKTQKLIHSYQSQRDEVAYFK